MADNSRDFLIKIISDAQSVARTKSDLDATKRGLQDLETYGYSVGKTLGALQRTAKLDALGEQFGKMSVKINDTDEAARRLSVTLKTMGANAQETARATQSFFNAQQAAQEAGAGGGINLARIGGQLRQLPSTPIPGTSLTTDAVANIIRLGGAFQQVAKNSDLLKEKVLGAAQAIGYGNIGMVASIAALAVVIKILTDRTNEVRKAALEEIDVRTKAIQLLATGTRQEVQDRINELAKERQAKEVAAATTQRFLSDLEKEIDARGKNQLALANWNATIGTGAGELKAAREAADAANKELNKTTNELDLLQQGSGLTAQSTADLAKAEAALALRRQEAAEAIARVEDNLSAAKEAQQFINDGSLESLEKRKDSIRQELQLIADAQQNAADLFNAAAGDAEKQKAYRAEVEKLTAQFNTLSRTYDALANNQVELAVRNNDGIKAQGQAKKELDKIALEAANDEKKRAADVQNINEKTGESFRKLKEAYDQAGIEETIKRAEEDAKTLRQRADEDFKTKLERDAKLKSVDADTTEKLSKAEVDRQEKLKKIRDQYALDEADAVQNRDAVALAKAQAKRDKDTSDAEDSLKDQQKQIADDRNKRLKELRDDFALQDRLTQLNRAAQDRETRIARENDTAARRRKYQQDQAELVANQQREIAQRNAAYAKQIGDLQAYLSNAMKTQQGYYGDILAYAIKVRADLAKVLGGNGGSSASPPPGAAGGGFTPAGKVPPSGRVVPTFDTGGMVSRTGYAWVHQNELILTPKQQSQMMGGITLNVNGQGKAAVKQQISAHIDEIWGRMGW